MDTQKVTELKMAKGYISKLLNQAGFEEATEMNKLKPGLYFATPAGEDFKDLVLIFESKEQASKTIPLIAKAHITFVRPDKKLYSIVLLMKDILRECSKENGNEIDCDPQEPILPMPESAGAEKEAQKIPEWTFPKILEKILELIGVKHKSVGNSKEGEIKYKTVYVETNEQASLVANALRADIPGIVAKLRAIYIPTDSLAKAKSGKAASKKGNKDNLEEVVEVPKALAVAAENVSAELPAEDERADVSTTPLEEEVVETPKEETAKVELGEGPWTSQRILDFISKIPEVAFTSNGTKWIGGIKHRVFRLRTLEEAVIVGEKIVVAIPSAVVQLTGVCVPATVLGIPEGPQKRKNLKKPEKSPDARTMDNILAELMQRVRIDVIETVRSEVEQEYNGKVETIQESLREKDEELQTAREQLRQAKTEMAQLRSKNFIISKNGVSTLIFDTSAFGTDIQVSPKGVSLNKKLLINHCSE